MMNEMTIQSAAVKDSLKLRLRRIEGQVRGVERMLDDDRDCKEILQQLTAIRAAVHNSTQIFLRTYAKECLARADSHNQAARDAIIDDVMDLITKAR